MVKVEKRGQHVGVLASRAVPRRTKQGFLVKPFTISPHHWEALRREAFRRAAEVGSGKPDASALLREILDAWLAKQRAKS